MNRKRIGVPKQSIDRGNKAQQNATMFSNSKQINLSTKYSPESPPPPTYLTKQILHSSCKSSQPAVLHRSHSRSLPLRWILRIFPSLCFAVASPFFGRLPESESKKQRVCEKTGRHRRAALRRLSALTLTDACRSLAGQAGWWCTRLSIAVLWRQWGSPWSEEYTWGHGSAASGTAGPKRTRSCCVLMVQQTSREVIHFPFWAEVCSRLCSSRWWRWGCFRLNRGGGDHRRRGTLLFSVFPFDGLLLLLDQMKTSIL